MQTPTDFVQVYRAWASERANPKISEFLGWLGDHCKVTAGDVMTDAEFEDIRILAGATPMEAEDALMESAWP